uniref:Tubulin polymerization promoting protein n=1 Tax=Cyprinus carpio TaxID=7962 RepID=A0A8C1T1B2_CYPCA
ETHKYSQCANTAGTTFLTHLGTLCVEDCKPDGGEYKCKTIDKDGRSQNMYCSPQENMDYWGRQCRADSMCGKYGEDYCWCRINIFSWGYCGLVKADKKLIDSGEGTHITSRHRNRRDPEVIDTEDDQGNHIKTIFTAVAAPRDITDGTRYRNEAENLIGRWTNVHLGNQARSKLITSEHLRIDLQGHINRNNQRYYNLQIQVDNRTIAQIIIPDEIPERYVRRAFLESFNRRARVFIDVSKY